MIGWLLDTNVVASMIHPSGAPSVKAWALHPREDDVFISVLTLGEYDKGIWNLAEDHQDRARYVALREAVMLRFKGRILSVTDAVVRNWGRLYASPLASALLGKREGETAMVAGAEVEIVAIDRP